MFSTLVAHLKRKSFLIVSPFSSLKRRRNILRYLSVVGSGKMFSSSTAASRMEDHLEMKKLLKYYTLRLFSTNL